MAFPKYGTLWMVFALLVTSTDCKRNLPASVKSDIHSNQDAVTKIIRSVKDGGAFHNRAFQRLANFTDTFGPRPSGSQRLEQAIDHVLSEMRKEGFDSVETETVTVPRWERGQEFARMLEPRELSLQILGLGGSIGTQNFTGGKLTAEVVIVKTFEELDRRAAEVRGKIVVYNQKWEGYGETVAYRSGAGKASKLGALATLIKSVTDFSLYTPHTGQQIYGDATPIPTACITVEDADFIQRLSDNGHKVKIELKMEAYNFPTVTSRNIVAEIRGSTHPDQVVLFGGHIDSWDVGSGVMDDGGGSIISWQVLSMVKALNLRPQRTLRCVLWTAEEVGLVGGREYYRRHKENIDNMVLMMEADSGIFEPVGLKFSGSGLAKAYLEEVMSLLDEAGTTGLNDTGASYPDISMWPDEVPRASLDTRNEHYFWYHHTNADSITLLEPWHLDISAAIWASAAYVVANLDKPLPRTGSYPSVSAATAHPPQWMNLMLILLLSLVVCAKRSF